MSTVLVVEDETRLLGLLRRYLMQAGHTTFGAAEGNEAIRLLHEHAFDLVLLDLLLPGADGMWVLRELGDRGAMPPVIVVSGVDEVGSRVMALDLGAVDYVGKPFTPAELLARVRRHLSSPCPPAAHPQRYLRVGSIELDLHRRRASIGDSLVCLPEREFALLAHLMRNPGRVCTREELLHDVWGLDFDPGSNVVEVCVRRLRAKFPDVPIETVRSAGYLYDAS